MIGFGDVPALSSPSPRAGSASDSFAGLWRIADPQKKTYTMCGKASEFLGHGFEAVQSDLLAKLAGMKL